ncbi:MAG: universal stress protein [Armatimonadota bacterium]|nr:universal stress protein [Armatimonadota bacterium]
MIIEARDDLVMLEGSLDKNLWPTIQAAANLLLRQNTQGIIIDGSELTGCSPEGAETFRDAMDYIERYRARIVVCQLPESVMEVVRAVPGVRSRLPVAATLEDARNSLRLARTGAGQTSGAGGRALQDILVPLLQGDTPETATVLACRLARSEGQQTQVHLAYIFEVPRQLPLNAPLPEEETQASETLAAAENWVRREGLKPMTHVARARDVGEEIVHQAGLLNADIIVLSCGAAGQPGEDFMARVGRPVLDHAPCEVILSKLPPVSPV